MRKKQKKYFEFLSVQEPTVRLVASMYYMQDPLKIMSVASKKQNSMTFHPASIISILIPHYTLHFIVDILKTRVSRPSVRLFVLHVSTDVLTWTLPFVVAVV